MMSLSEYLALEGISQKDFAARIGRKQATVSRLVSGSALPNLEIAQKIEKATDGKVTVADLRPDWAEAFAPNKKVAAE